MQVMDRCAATLDKSRGRWPNYQDEAKGRVKCEMAEARAVRGGFRMTLYETAKIELPHCVHA